MTARQIAGPRMALAYCAKPPLTTGYGENAKHSAQGRCRWTGRPNGSPDFPRSDTKTRSPSLRDLPKTPWLIRIDSALTGEMPGELLQRDS